MPLHHQPTPAPATIGRMSSVPGVRSSRRPRHWSAWTHHRHPIAPPVAELLARSLVLVVAVLLVVAVGSALMSLVAGTLGGGALLRQIGQLLAASLAWLLVNQPVEGRVLLVVAPGHGLTQADLLVLPAVLLAGLLTAIRLKSRGRP